MNVMEISQIKNVNMPEIIAKYPRFVYQTCEDYYLDGFTEPGNYSIDPDLDGPINSFIVYCDFKISPFTYTHTKIFHNKMTKQNISHCRQKGPILMKNRHVLINF